MRSLILAVSMFLGLAAHADATNDALKTTVKDLMAIVAVANQTQRVDQLCKLVKADVDNAAIGPQILGSFSSFTPDQGGINAFYALVPSIIVTDFYGLVSDKAGAAYSVDTTAIPKGSTKVAYKVSVGGTELTVTMSKKNNKVLDVEFMSFSLIKTKADQYQNDIQGKSASSAKPITDFVNELVASGKLIRCN
jgi:ABC-type transporter MlaC component